PHRTRRVRKVTAGRLLLWLFILKIDLHRQVGQSHLRDMRGRCTHQRLLRLSGTGRASCHLRYVTGQLARASFKDAGTGDDSKWFRMWWPGTDLNPDPSLITRKLLN